MAIKVSIHEAKTHLSRLLHQVMSGEEIIIAKSGVPVARIIPIEQKKKKRQAGSAKGKFVIPETFYDALPEETLAAFESN